MFAQATLKHAECVSMHIEETAEDRDVSRSRRPAGHRNAAPSERVDEHP
jgi:hypothetical protein